LIIEVEVEGFDLRFVMEQLWWHLKKIEAWVWVSCRCLQKNNRIGVALDMHWQGCNYRLVKLHPCFINVNNSMIGTTFKHIENLKI